MNTCNGFSNRIFARTIERFLSSRTDNWSTFGAERFFDTTSNVCQMNDIHMPSSSHLIFKIQKQHLIWHIFSMSAIRKNYACLLSLQTFVTKISQQPNWKPCLIHRIILTLSTSVYQHFDFVNQLEINWSIPLLSDHDATTFSHENYWSHHQPSHFHYQIHTKHVSCHNQHCKFIAAFDESDRKYF